MAKTPPLKKPTFGGPRKTGHKSAPKKVLEQWGPVPKKASGVKDTAIPGNREFGFIQATPKQATGAMMGRAPSFKTKSSGPASSGARKQFKPKAGKKVF